MSHYAFPEGYYFSVIGNIRIGAGGQTRMALLRHRLLQTHAGVTIPLVTFNPVPSYNPVREHLRTEGLLLESSQLINMHEWLRTNVWNKDEQRAPALPLAEHTVEERYEDPDGNKPWRVFVAGSHSGEDHWDYLRPDGTRYLQTPADSMLGTTRVIDHQERIVADLDGLGDLWRWWVNKLLPANGPIFLISDSRFIAFELGLLNNPRVHLLHQMHNPHQGGQRVWNSPISASYQQSMEALGNLDTLSVLTERQRQDIEYFYGATDNLVVIPNPIDLAPLPDPIPARPHGRIVMVARLESQKRIDLAVSAFAIVAGKNAAAHLDIFGDGPDRELIENQIAEAGLTDRITLHGQQPHAANEFWTADLGWLTSDFEGFPLVLLEGRVRGCPFLAFDISYGPAEQIQNGVDGFLVKAGDVEALAETTLDLLADPESIEGMRGATRAGALAHGYESFLHAWANACVEAQTRKPNRTQINSLSFTGPKLRLNGSTAKLDGILHIKGTGDRSDLRVRWQMWLPDSPAPIDLPLQTQVVGDEIALLGKTQGQELPFKVTDPRAKSRLLIEWRNSAQSIVLSTRKPTSAARSIARKIRKKLS